jgi:hypothetical protein
MNHFIGKTKKYCVGKCDKGAVKWDGFLLKSRDKVEAGFCEHHWMITLCPNSYNKKGCFGIYNKQLEVIF